MKNLKLFLLLALSCIFAISCTDDEVNEQEAEYIEGGIPDGLEVGMIYAISHDKLNDKCTFTLYLGNNPDEETINEYIGKTVDVYALDENDDLIMAVTLKSFEIGDTFTIPCAYCERSVEFYIFHDIGKTSIRKVQSWNSVHHFQY